MTKGVQACASERSRPDPPFVAYLPDSKLSTSYPLSFAPNQIPSGPTYCGCHCPLEYCRGLFPKHLKIILKWEESSSFILLFKGKKTTLMSSGYLWSVNSHCLLLDVCLLETWPRLEHPPLARGGGREGGRGVNFLIETPGKFMEDEKSSSKATPHNDPNEFMQMC